MGARTSYTKNANGYSAPMADQLITDAASDVALPRDVNAACDSLTDFDDDCGLAMPLRDCVDDETGKAYSDKYSELYRDLIVSLTQDGIASSLRLTKRALIEGKLGFYSCKAFIPGHEAKIHADLYGKTFEASVSVSECRPKKDLYVVELEMVEDIAFQARIFLQLAAIANYKESCDCVGRCLSIDEAAFEWIEEHAEGFAQEFENRVNDSVV